MAVQALAAVARALLKTGAKKAAKGAAAKASRAMRKGDIATNARKRYYRSAERNLAKAEQSTGATRSRYRALARQDFEDALSTYDPSTTQKFSKPIQRLADEFGIDLDKARSRFTSDSKQREKSIKRSAESLESSMRDPEARREKEARALLSNKKIGKRIMGGLVDIWRDEATIVTDTGELKVDQSKILPSLFDYFNVDNVADMLEKVEQIIGDKLYADEDQDSMYEAVKIMLQTKIADNALVA